MVIQFDVKGEGLPWQKGPGPDQLPLASHVMVESPCELKPTSHTYVTLAPNVVEVTVEAGLLLAGEGGLLQSTTV